MCRCVQVFTSVQACAMVCQRQNVCVIAYEHVCRCMQVCVCVCVFTCSGVVLEQLHHQDRAQRLQPRQCWRPGPSWKRLVSLEQPFGSASLLSPFRTLLSPLDDKQGQDVRPAAIRDRDAHLSLQPGGSPEPSPLGQGGSWSTGVRGCREVGPGATRLSSGAGLTERGQQLISSQKSQVDLSLSSLTVPSSCHP